MYGLEYALFFGVPENKCELIDGKSYWSFPSRNREESEGQFRAWVETICRWKQVEEPVVHQSGQRWTTTIAGIEIELFPRPISMKVPIAYEAYMAFMRTFNRRDFWPGQPPGLETGWDSNWDRGDIRLNLWSMFKDLSSRHGGRHCSRTDIAISDSAAVAPCAYYYRPGREQIMIEGDYFCAAPDVVAEVLSAPSRALDRGPRREVYRRAAVPHLWLLEPAFEVVEVYRLEEQYELQGTYRINESFTTDLFPGERIAVKELFETQSKRRPSAGVDDEPEPIPQWLLPSDFTVGLEYFFHLGHPEHRWEFWSNKARSVLAFGSAEEAKVRLDHFCAEASRWEGASPAKVGCMTEDIDQAELGRFLLTRHGRLVYLDIAIDGRLYNDLLRIWGQRDAWDWGED